LCNVGVFLKNHVVEASWLLNPLSANVGASYRQIHYKWPRCFWKRRKFANGVLHFVFRFRVNRQKSHWKVRI